MVYRDCRQSHITHNWTAGELQFNDTCHHQATGDLVAKQQYQDLYLQSRNTELPEVTEPRNV